MRLTRRRGTCGMICTMIDLKNYTGPCARCGDDVTMNTGKWDSKTRRAYCDRCASVLNKKALEKAGQSNMFGGGEAERPELTKSVAKSIAQRFDKSMVIVYHFRGDGEFGYVSYGSDKERCDMAKSIADEMWEYVMNS